MDTTNCQPRPTPRPGRLQSPSLNCDSDFHVGFWCMGWGHRDPQSRAMTDTRGNLQLQLVAQQPSTGTAADATRFWPHFSAPATDRTGVTHQEVYRHPRTSVGLTCGQLDLGPVDRPTLASLNPEERGAHTLDDVGHRWKVDGDLVG